MKTQDVPNWLKESRDKWEYRGQKRPSFAIIPKPGQRSVWDFPRPPLIEKIDNLVIVSHQGNVVSRTTQALTVLETAGPPTYYIPETDVELSTLVMIRNRSSLCEWKGKATYWALKDSPNIPVAWSYKKPFPEYEKLTNYFAFYPQLLDCRVDGTQVIPQPGKFYAGWITPDLVGPFKGEKGTEHW